uniref:POU-specific domain-containing protein n=1 Tax=Macrostomum lignano TaxID=282301 RepID=A0A1I8FKL5_9PLAT
DSNSFNRMATSVTHGVAGGGGASPVHPSNAADTNGGSAAAAQAAAAAAAAAASHGSSYARYPCSGTAADAGSSSSKPAEMPEPGEAPSSDDLEQFAKMFKQRRIKLGYTSRPTLAWRSARLYGNVFSARPPSAALRRCSCPSRTCCKLKPLLSKVLEEADSSTGFANQSGQNRGPRPKAEEADEHRAEHEGRSGEPLQPAPEAGGAQEITQLATPSASRRRSSASGSATRRQKEKRMTPPNNLPQGCSAREAKGSRQGRDTPRRTRGNSKRFESGREKPIKTSPEADGAAADT